MISNCVVAWPWRWLLTVTFTVLRVVRARITASAFPRWLECSASAKDSTIEGAPFPRRPGLPLPVDGHQDAQIRETSSIRAHFAPFGNKVQTQLTR
jgi:hypothetical protein